MTDEQKKKNDKNVQALAQRFYKHLNKTRPLVPGLYKLMMFRIHRSSIQSLGEQFYDYCYFREKGWFESDYYYEVRLGLGKRIMGIIFDVIGKRLGMKNQK